MIENTVKLVVWDLDDTFWQGTLTEGGITAIPRNTEIVRALSSRGIVSSICSKNDRQAARAKLIELGIWDHFVFPAIEFSPKGKMVAATIAGAGLRPQNVLFIDDSTSNLEEVRFFNPGIMTAHPADVLGMLLDHPHCAGRPDPELSRLKQYRFLGQKMDALKSSQLSNEEFLRTSDIRISIDYDVEAHFDRVIELINRSNQLNYTKVRISTDEEIEAFRNSLSLFGYHAGCVHAVDRYGDYGLIGFFQKRQRAMNQSLVHFVFSCRTMNMGIEQYVYENLGRPAIDIAEPVSYGLDSHAAIDWIRAESGSSHTEETPESRKLLLLGGCDLLQLASYCSSDRVEFVNRAEDDSKVRYDDPGFVLADRNKISACEPLLRRIPCWNHDDAVRFDKALAEAEIAIVSLWTGTRGEFYQAKNGLRIRLGALQTKRLEDFDAEWFKENLAPLVLTGDERLKLITESLARIGSKTGKRCRVFVLGCYTLGTKNSDRIGTRKRYNDTVRDFCSLHPDRFQYVDLDELISPDDQVDRVHFTRGSYHKLARHILISLEKIDEARAPRAPNRSSGAPISGLVQRFSLLVRRMKSAA